VIETNTIASEELRIQRSTMSNGMVGSSTVSRNTGALFKFVQFVIDLVALNFTYHLVLYIRFGSFFAVGNDQLHAPWSVYPELEIYVNILWTVIAIMLRVYKKAEVHTGERFGANLREIRTVGRASLLLAGGLLLAIVARGGYNYYSRIFLAYFLTAAPLVLIGIRIIMQAAITTVRQQSPKKNVLVIGAGSSGAQFYKAIAKHPRYGYRIYGFLDNDGKESDVRGLIKGKLDDLDRILGSESIDEVVLAIPGTDKQTIASLVAQCENRCVRVALLYENDLAFNGFRTAEYIGDVSLVHLQESALDRLPNRILKRAFDIVFSAIVLTTVFPIVWLVSAILIKLTSSGPIFFKQPRTGEDGRTFICYKFRTMREDSKAHTVQATRNDPRLTAIGRILRRTSLDELPQFWNVLQGNMSVVGPRPHMLKHTEDYRNVIAQYMVRHFVKPGLTGWAQINGYRGETREQSAMQHRIEHDLYYIENWSFLFDLTIIVRTVVRLLRGDFNAY